MNKFFAIAPVNADPFLITWDLGRRCNYDCSYCPTHRHDNYSSHASLDELKQTTDFLFDYITIISKYRQNKDFHISFTGGEPTVNPDFIQFAKYIRNKYEKNYKDNFNLKLDLTTNAAMSSKICKSICENFDYVTVSYHSEAKQKLKLRVKQRILELYSSQINLKVNVMFHAQYFNECIDLCDWLKSNNIKFIPRLIGEDPASAFSQAHLYTEEQKKWLEEFWNMDLSPLHRPCCGGRTFTICSTQGNTITNSVNHRQFQGWYCSVNWFFLHIEQQSGLIFHHQTCQARLDSTRGAIGNINQADIILENLKILLSGKQMPVIVCPNKLCGCGLCTPKSNDRHELLKNMPMVVNDLTVFNVS